PPPRAAGNLQRRERASMQRRICRRSPNVRNRPHTARGHAPVASFHESTQRMGFVSRERSIGLTPRVKLRARPAPSRPNCDTSSHQLLNTVLHARQLQRFRYAAAWLNRRYVSPCRFRHWPAGRYRTAPMRRLTSLTAWPPLSTSSSFGTRLTSRSYASA